MTELLKNRDQAKNLIDEANKYIDLVEKIPLYQIDRYRLIHHCLELLDILGYSYDIDSRHKLVVVNHYHDPDTDSLFEPIRNNYYELSKIAKRMAMYETDRQNLLFQFREIIFGLDTSAIYHLCGDSFDLLTKD